MCKHEVNFGFHNRFVQPIVRSAANSGVQLLTKTRGYDFEVPLQDVSRRWFHIPSGKHTKNYGKSPLFMGKLTINGPFSIAMLVYQRVATLVYCSQNCWVYGRCMELVGFETKPINTGGMTLYSQFPHPICSMATHSTEAKFTSKCW